MRAANCATPRSLRTTWYHTRVRTIRFGHTPDPDDAFMFFGLARGLATIPGYRVRHVLADIETLNRRARRGNLEVTAISAAAYPELADRYWILGTGASVGDGYGPVLVTRQGGRAQWPVGHEGPHVGEIGTARIAVPGMKTTAALLLRLIYPRCRPVPVRFDLIPKAVLSGRVDAGVLIHEGQLAYRDWGLRKRLDFGVWWKRETGLPLPLGLDVVRKNLGRPLARQIRRALAASIREAYKRLPEALRYALQYGRGLDRRRGAKFVKMYVDRRTLDLGADGRRGLAELYRRAAAAGLMKKVPPVTIV